MSGSLVKVSQTIVSSGVSAVTLTGIDSTYDVYMLAMNNVSPDTADADVYLRVTESGSASADSDYDFVAKMTRADTTFSDIANNGQTSWGLSGSLENDTGKTFNGLCYIFNANNSSEYTFITCENAYLAEDGTFLGNQGGGVYKQATTVDGVSIQLLESSSGNIDSGTFTLYGLIK